MIWIVYDWFRISFIITIGFVLLCLPKQFVLPEKNNSALLQK